MLLDANIPLYALGGGNIADVAKAKAAKAFRVACKAKALAILAAVGKIEERVGSGIGLSDDFDRVLVLNVVVAIVAVAVAVAAIGGWFGRNGRHDGSTNMRLEKVVPVVFGGIFDQTWDGGPFVDLAVLQSGCVDSGGSISRRNVFALFVFVRCKRSQYRRLAIASHLFLRLFKASRLVGMHRLYHVVLVFGIFDSGDVDPIQQS